VVNVATGLEQIRKNCYARNVQSEEKTMTEIPYRKAVGEFNILVDKQLEIFNLYGLGVFIPAIGLEITKAAMKLHRELSKVDKEIK
jgi:hypothetical protein